MSYRCNVCDVPVPNGPLLRWSRHREDGSILSEIPCCSECHRQLSQGTQLYDLLRSAEERRRHPIVTRLPEPAPAPTELPPVPAMVPAAVAMPPLNGTTSAKRSRPPRKKAAPTNVRKTAK